MVSYNRLSYGFDAAIFVDDDARSSADSEGVSHFSGVCTPIAHVVEFFSQGSLTLLIVCGTDNSDYFGNDHVLKCHWWRGNDVADGVAYTVYDGQLQLLLGGHPVVSNFVPDTCHGDL